MADFAFCTQDRCPLRLRCRRTTTTHTSVTQSWATFPRWWEGDMLDCEFRMPTERTADSAPEERK